MKDCYDIFDLKRKERIKAMKINYLVKQVKRCFDNYSKRIGKNIEDRMIVRM